MHSWQIVLDYAATVSAKSLTMKKQIASLISHIDSMRSQPYSQFVSDFSPWLTFATHPSFLPISQGKSHAQSIQQTTPAYLGAGALAQTLPVQNETTDIAGDRSSTAKMVVGTSVQGKIGFAGDHDWYRIELQQGKTYTFALMGTGLDMLEDATLRLFNANGTQVLRTDDDGAPGLGSVIGLPSPLGSGQFVAPYTGSYYLDVSGYDFRQLGQYGLSAIESSSSQGYKPSFDLLMGAAAIRSDEASGSPDDWNQVLNQPRGQGLVVTYSFRDSVTYTTSDTSSFSKVSAFEMAAINSALKLIAEVSNIQFVQVSGANGYSNNGQIVIANYNNRSDGSGAYAYYPGPMQGGDIWINTAAINPNVAIQPGSYAWFAILHELGHAVGLSHPGDYNVGSGVLSYQNAAQFLQDSNQFTLMSYWGGGNTGETPSGFATAYTPLLYDILALQTLYGANTSTRSSDTVYGFNANAGSLYSFVVNKIPILSLWDGGGLDRLDASLFTQKQTINLEQGSFSDIGGGKLNLSIALGAVIEQAFGGLADDVITGNDVDNLLKGNNGNDALNGLAGNDTLEGDAGNDTLNGGLGVDTLTGGIGNDTYLVDEPADIIIELAAQGTDNVLAAVSYTLSAHLEQLQLTGNQAINGSGNELANLLTGNAGNNQLLGGAGNDTLNGSTGTDTLLGGLGDDIYLMDDGQDTVSELVGEGTDQVTASISYTLSANVERLLLTGTQAIHGNGNELANLLTGNAARNQLNGGAGNDTLNGGLGADTLLGGLGDDSYTVDDAGDVVTELLNEGTDTVNSAISYTLNANVERLTLTGTLAIEGSGNELANALTGNSANNQLFGASGNDVLNGAAGADTLAGGLGDDIYFVDHTGDVIIEQLNEGRDFISSTVSYTLPAYVERMMLTGTANIDATGNELANYLSGNAAANQLLGAAGNDTMDGGSGIDTLLGGLGDDSYTVDNSADVIVEQFNEGTDTVTATANYTLSAHLERLTLGGTLALQGTGNAQANLLTGNIANNQLAGAEGNDTLVGGLGADTLLGGVGDDSYTVDDVGDVVIEAADTGLDTVTTLVSYTLSDHIERLTLGGSAAIQGTGNAQANLLTGNAAGNQLNGGDGNDTLNGAAGDDTLLGGGGDDTYQVDHLLDNVIETAGSGLDTVISGVSYTLTEYVEQLQLTGSAALNGTGNAQANLLTGNNGINILSGDLGNDTLVAGGGNDRLIGGSGSDWLTGELGSDRFAYLLSSDSDGVISLDLITDFLSGIDKIDLNAVRSELGGRSFAYIGSNAFNSLDATGQIRFDQQRLYISTDTDNQAEMQIQLAGVTSMQTSDFIL